MTEPSLWNIPLSSSEVKDIYDNMYGGQRCLDILPFSSDLITNGNFSQIGPELITNGDFTDTGANELLNGGFDTAIPLGTAGSGWNDSVADGNTIAYSAGGVKLTVLGVSAADCKLYAKTAAGSSNVLEIGKSYKVTYEVISQTSTPALTYYIGGTYVTVPSSIGFHTYYFTQASNQISIFRNNTLNSDITLDNISIQEVGQGWTLAGDFEIGDTKALITNATQYSQLTQQEGSVFLSQNKNYKLQADIETLSISNAFAYRTTGGSVTPIATSEIIGGKYTTYFTMPTDGYIWFQTTGSFTGLNVSITNISVKEVLSENEWHHLALSIDRDSEWKWYVDGVLTNTMDNATDQAPLLAASTLGLTNYSTAIASFYGNMTEPSLWNIPLSSSEVKDIYDNMYGGQKCLDILPFTSDLITNGNFSQIGPELVTNGDFSATGSELMPTIGTIVNAGGGSITLISGISYSSTSDGTSGSSIRPKIDLATTSSKSYKLVITPTSTPTGTTNCDFYDGSSYLFQDYDFTTTKEIYFVDNGSVFLSFDGAQIYDVPSFTISVKELGEDWGESGDSTISIGTHEGRTDVADINIGDTSTASRIYQSLTWTEGKTYKVTCEVYVVSGSFRIDVSNSLYASDIVQTSTTDSWQTLTGYMVALKDSTEQFWLRSSVEIAQFYVDSVSIQEVGQGWEAEGTGSGVVTFPNGMARIETVAAPNSAYIRQYSVMEVGKSYTMTYRIVSNNGGTLYNSGQTPTTMDSTVGSHSETFIAGSSNLLISRSGDNTDVSITNITLTQVGSGNLERWWRMNGTEPSLITLPNVAPNGTVNDCVPAGSPIIQLDTP